MIRTKWKALLCAGAGAAASLTASAAPIVAGAGAASAATATGAVPPWEPDANAAAPYANVVFFDSSGNQVTSGSNDLTNPFAWAVGTTAADVPSPKADLIFSKPQFASPPNPALWGGVAEGGPTAFSPSVSGAPASVAAFAPTYPVVKAAANISAFASSQSTDPTAGYTDIIQVRVQDTAIFGTTTYWDTDIAYNTTSSPTTVDGVAVPADGWAQLFPEHSGTATSLATSAASGSLNVGQQITLNATVTGATTGSVNFFDNGTFLINEPVSSGAASYSYTPGGGNQSYTASFVPGPTPGSETGTNTSSATVLEGSSSSAVAVSVTAPATTTTLTSSVNPSVYGQSTTYTATVSSTSAVTAGSVGFTADGSPINGCTSVPVNSSGVANCSAAGGAVGSHSVVATYTPGAAPFQGSTSSALTETVNQAATATSLTAAPSPAGAGQTVTLTATVAPVAPGAGTPTGTVSFELGGAAITAPNDCSAVTIVSGKATCSTTLSSGIGQSLSAIYSGDANFTTSTGTTTEDVYPNTTTTVTSSLNPSVYGSSVMYTASVTSTSTVNGGTVAFTDNGKAITGCGVQAVTNGSATCSTTTASLGSNTIGATYNPGSAQFGGSSGTTSQTVNSDGTTATLAVGPASPVGESVTYTVSVDPATTTTAAPSGKVAFSDGPGNPASTLCASVSLSGGQASCKVTYSKAGSYSVSATYTSDNPGFTGSSAASKTQTINPAGTATTLASSENPGFTGKAVTYTATVGVTAPGAGSPTGTVSFSDGSSVISGCSAQKVVSGKATCSVTYADTSGSPHSIAATYSGDSNFDTSSSSSALSETIDQAVAPSAPTALAAKAGDSKVALIWKAPASSGTFPVSGYNVFVGTAPGGEATKPVNASPVTGTSYTVTGLTNDKKYYFTVVAVSPAGSSPSSNEASATPKRTAGYVLVGRDGGVFAFGVPFKGSLGNVKLAAPIVGAAETPDKNGYWVVAKDGGVFAFGDAGFYGSLGKVHLAAPIATIVATPTGKGYWLIGTDGGVFNFGDAGFHGSLGAIHLNGPIVAAAATSDGAGYWLVGSDGGIFNFGDAGYHGSLGNLHLNAPIVGIAPSGDNGGYTLVGSDGGVFGLGDAGFYGSLGGVHLVQPVVGVVPTSDGKGYTLVAADGGAFCFGDSTFVGSLGGTGVNDIVAAG